MDNKITKKRLNSIFSYGWIKLLVLIVALIFVWELIFAFTSVRITTGQRFNIQYDIGVVKKKDSGIREIMLKNNGVSTINVILMESESFSEDTDLLWTRLEVSDGDIIFSNLIRDEDDGRVRAMTVIDSNYIYDFETLLSDAKAYLESFKDGNEYSREKTDAHFLSRMKGDNRYRTKEQRELGKEEEYQRIIKLDEEVKAFEKLLTHTEVLFKYKKYQNAFDTADENEKTKYEEVLKVEQEKYYGIDLGKLPTAENKPSISEFVSISGNDGADGVVLMAVNFYSEQPDEQFEVLTFITTLVKACSNILD